jgi:hypothetical protein
MRSGNLSLPLTLTGTIGTAKLGIISKLIQVGASVCAPDTAMAPKIAPAMVQEILFFITLTIPSLGSK